jgi:putative endonuclease
MTPPSGDPQAPHRVLPAAPARQPLLTSFRDWLAGLFPAKSLGVRGERLAATHLKRKGYRILERNFVVGDDEADLIALDPDGRTIVIVEVKTRAAGDPDAAMLAVTRTKQFRMARLAASLCRRKAYRDRPFRFDAVAIHWPAGSEPVVTHHVAAFNSPW